MSRIKSKFIRFGTGTDEVNSRIIPANFTPSNYTPDEVASEGTDKISANLKGIDNALGSIVGTPGDIVEQGFTALDNQSSAQNITNFSFNNANIRSFEAVVSISRDNTFQSLHITGIQKSSDWQLAITRLGDDTGISLDITSAGQMQYTSSNTGEDAEIRFRSIITRKI